MNSVQKLLDLANVEIKPLSADTQLELVKWIYRLESVAIDGFYRDGEYGFVFADEGITIRTSEKFSEALAAIILATNPSIEEGQKLVEILRRN